MGIEVTLDEADKRRLDPLEVRNKQPGKHYRWLRKSELNIAKKKYLGYDLVDNSGPEQATLDSSTRMKKGTDVDTTIQVGDLVLGVMSEERHQQLRKENQDKIKHRTHGVEIAYRNAQRQAARGEDVGFVEHRDNRSMSEGMTEQEYEERESYLERKRKGR